MFNNIISNKGMISTKVLDELYKEALDLSRAVVEYFKANKKGNFQHLDANVMACYTLECNRITAGIMQSMSWCLMQKGVKSGEISSEKASRKENRLTTNDLFMRSIGCDTDHFPKDFMEYSDRARALYSRIIRMDRILYDSDADSDRNPVRDLINKIEQNGDM